MILQAVCERKHIFVKQFSYLYKVVYILDISLRFVPYTEYASLFSMTSQNLVIACESQNVSCNFAIELHCSSVDPYNYHVPAGVCA